MTELVKKVHIKGKIGEERFSLWTSPYLSEDRADKLLKAFADPEFPLVTKPRVQSGICHRRVAFFSDEAHSYPFAGQEALAEPLATHPWLGKLLRRVNRLLETEFNGILINHYRTGGRLYIICL